MVKFVAKLRVTMKELLLQYAQYNIWANKRIIETMSELPEAATEQKINSSFTTIRATVYHTWSAESIWLQRLVRAQEQIWQEAVHFGDFKDACAKWEQASADLATYVNDQTDGSLQESISFFDRSSNPHTMTIYHILLHVFNHSTYHRGQLVTMMRQAGAEKIPGTDFIGYARMKL